MNEISLDMVTSQKSKAKCNTTLGKHAFTHPCRLTVYNKLSFNVTLLECTSGLDPGADIRCLSLQLQPPWHMTQLKAVVCYDEASMQLSDDVSVGKSHSYQARPKMRIKGEGPSGGNGKE